MATTVTLDQLRELAAFRAAGRCAVSLFLDLDPATVPTAADAETRLNSLLSNVEKHEDELRRDEKLAVERDLERIRRYVDEEFDRDGAHGLAVFAAEGDGVWRALPLGERVADGVTVDRTFELAPLVPLVGRGAGVLVAAVGRERGDVYRLRAGRLVEVADHSEEQPRRHDQGGWSQARYQRHIDNLEAEHMRVVADEINERVRRSHELGVVVVCSEEKRAAFAELLSQEAEATLAGWATAEAHAGPPELLTAVEPVLDEWEARREREALDRWREEAGQGARATTGWADTLDAASDGRVELLLVGDGANREAYACPECGRAAAAGTECPLDGATMERTASGLDLVVRQTLAYGGDVLAVRHHDDLAPVEGVGALLRF